MKGAGEAGSPRIIGLMLVHNDDRFVGRALLNILEFCDQVIVLDHISTDRTPEILGKIAAAAGGKVELHRIENVAESHAFVLPFVGRPAWMLAVDGDELYDPVGLARLRPRLLSGEFRGYWRLYGHVLNATRLNAKKGTAKGHLSPPGHPMTKLYNMEAIESWVDAPQRLHGGTMTLRPRWNVRDGVYAFFHHVEWAESPFRCLHMVFVRRSSMRAPLFPRLSPADVIHAQVLGVDAWARAKVWAYHLWMAWRRKSGKDVAYRKGPQVELHASAFFSKGSPH